MIRRVSIVWAVALAALACSRQDDADPGIAMAPALKSAPSVAILDRISGASARIAHYGVRRVRMNYRIIDVQRDLEYTERVYSDGNGGFAIQVEDVVVPAMTPADEQFFVLLQENRQGFFFNHRDFDIRDVHLFHASYSARPTSTGEATICGRSCLEFEVTRRENPERTYVVDVDPTTGIVMRYEERGIDGSLLSSVAFEQFVLGPPPPSIELYKSPFERQPIDIDAPPIPQVGFEILKPTLIPPGYRLERVDSLEEGGRTWVRFVYGDGVERLFFLHSPQTFVGAKSVAGGGASDALSGPRNDRISVAPVGPWALAEGIVQKQGVMAMGKVSEPSLLRMIQSALESHH